MSADNWTTCPRCKAKYDAALEAKKIAVGKSYGKVTPEKYLEAFNALQKPEPLEDTLREDYCQHMNETGQYSCEYLCSCNVCDFSFKFDHEEQVKL